MFFVVFVNFFLDTFFFFFFLNLAHLGGWNL